MATQVRARAPVVAHEEQPRVPSRILIAAEVLMIAALPLLAYFALRLQLMPLPDINDPAQHTTYMVDPHDFFERFTEVLTPTARMREGARVGLLVPGRVAYLLFGPVGGFMAFRYALALVAIAPAYLLLRRLAGVAAGVTAAAVILTCPVIITAWGTDFPDSAAVSYLIAGLSCLAMPSTRHGVRWAAAGVVFLTLGVWAFASSLVFACIFAAVYLLLRRWREPADLKRDVLIGAGAWAATTLVLVLASGVLLGQFDFIVPTVYSLIYLAHPSQQALWHSTSWAWAPHESYLLVLPVVACAWLLAFGKQVRTLATPYLMVGLGFLLALCAAAFLQFVGRVQMLEEHYFSSLSWAAAMLSLCMVLAVVGRPLFEHRIWRWSIPLAVVFSAFLYEAIRDADANALRFSGIVFVAIGAVAVIALAVRAQRRLAETATARATILSLLCAFVAAVLLLTIAPVTQYATGPGLVFSPTPHYGNALGAGNSRAVDIYRVSAELPGFVGAPAYPGEKLVIWWPPQDQVDLLSPIGMFHSYYDTINGSFATLDASGVAYLDQRRPALVLLMSTTRSFRFPACLAALAPYSPQVIRTGALTSGSYTLYVWLIRLGAFSRRP